MVSKLSLNELRDLQTSRQQHNHSGGGSSHPLFLFITLYFLSYSKMTKSSFVFPTSNEGVVTATAASAAVTCNAAIGLITTESLTTAAAAEYVLTLTNNRLKVGSMVYATVGNGTSTQGTVVCSGGVSKTAGTVTIKVSNTHASEALNGTLLIGFFVVDQR